ncbi:MAG: D-alanyl-D-alanine carboxypeptidase DacB [Parcubacteria group bacterium GW2011_GWF2_38_8]|nr:MAG: D-alanyl-D-alanine carboxypeptidase DacB [Parcubacteria group bacterium GW2011_GWF2_38_8]
MEPAPRKNIFLFIILIILALEAVLFSVGNEKLNLAFLKEENRLMEVQSALAGIPIQAKAFSIYDRTLNRKIYGRNDEIALPIASLTKIMTVAIALNNHEADDIVLVRSDAIKQEGDYGFFVDEKFKTKDLAEFTLVGSANDGAYALAEDDGDFLEKMNNKAQKIGTESALFLNFTGLDIDGNKAGAYASAQDMNLIAIYALERYQDVFGATVLPELRTRSESGFFHSVKNTNIILDKIPGILFSKTGITPLAKGNLTVIYKNKYEHIIAITILGSTPEGRFSDAGKIIDTLAEIY